MVASLFSGIGLKIMGVVAVLFVVLGVIFRIRQAGRMAERVEAQTRVLRQVEVRHEIDRNIRRLAAGNAAERLRNEWSRDRGVLHDE